MLKKEKSSVLISFNRPNITASIFLQFTWVLVAVFNIVVHMSFSYTKINSHVLWLWMSWCPWDKKWNSFIDVIRATSLKTRLSSENKCFPAAALRDVVVEKGEQEVPDSRPSLHHHHYCCLKNSLDDTLVKYCNTYPKQRACKANRFTLSVDHSLNIATSYRGGNVKSTEMFYLLVFSCY